MNPEIATPPDPIQQVLDRMCAKQPVSDADRQAWIWKNVIRSGMRALGWPERCIRRIAPNWDCPPQERVFATLQKLLVGAGAVVAIVGTRGVGKTTLAAEIARMRMEREYDWFGVPERERTIPQPPAPGRYEKLGRLSAMFKPIYADFGSIGQDQLAALLETWCRTDLVVLDELHESEDLRTAMRFLADFVDRRYANRKDTILISNKDANAFRSEVNPSVISRIGHEGAIITCNWKSWRVKQ